MILLICKLKRLNYEIGTMFYSVGIPFYLVRNFNFRNTFSYIASNTISSYQLFLNEKGNCCNQLKVYGIKKVWQLLSLMDEVTHKEDLLLILWL
jgi:hypothetical protein